jgi:hypothetical protein
MMTAVTQRNLLLIALVGLSAAGTLFGLRILRGFDQTAGVGAEAPARWPLPSTIQLANDRPTLLVFAHPFCGCTAATLGELARIPARRSPKSLQPAITILFVRPKRSGWLASPLWDNARQLAGANVIWDEEGREARRFGVRTSGEVLLFDRYGDLLFHGGVTGSRGHAGDNYGADHLVAALDSGMPVQTGHLVFGCALASSGSLAAAEARP